MLWIILRAFSGGASAMTGTEAISNAVPVFKKPESKNASITLGVMATILAFLLVGGTGLGQVLHIVPKEGTTVLGEVGHAVYGGGFFYYALQVATMFILVLAANTSFTGFPRLASVLARGNLLPRQFMNRGDRLVFSNGIIGLTVAAIAILWVYRAHVHSLIPLYAVGVFTSFTLVTVGHGGPLVASKDPGLAAQGRDERHRGRSHGCGDGHRPRDEVHARRLYRLDSRGGAGGRFL